MAKQEPISINGEITEALGNSMFKVILDNGHEVIAHISGKIRLHSIRILVGDQVTMEMSPYDLTKARITRRLSGKTENKNK